jgi:23S rRNA pseudouridine1911/1915/1917 synthase
MSAPAPGSLRVPAAWAGERLDRALAAHLGLARNQVQAWIRAGRVRLGDAPARRPAEPLRGGEALAWDPPPRVDERIVPEPGALVLLHEDEHLLALDKPPGLVVHPGAGRPAGTLVHRLLARFPELAGVGGPGRPGIVHRLDRGTSGAMLVARTPETYQRLVRLFAGRGIDKRYLAVVTGAPRAARGTIEAPIGRHPRDRKRMAVVAAGRPALTEWRRLASAAGVALLEFAPRTGRTHQIRVHARHLGHPLVGDAVYGRAPRGAGPSAGFPRPALHAWRLRLPHPATGAPLELEAPVPDDLRELWRAATGDELPALPDAL